MLEMLIFSFRVCRNAYNMVLHKYGDLLYKGLEEVRISCATRILYCIYIYMEREMCSIYYY